MRTPPRKPNPTTAERPKPQKRGGKPPVAENKRLARQTRKILGKHYMSKYRVR